MSCCSVSVDAVAAASLTGRGSVFVALDETARSPTRCTRTRRTDLGQAADFHVKTNLGHAVDFVLVSSICIPTPGGKRSRDSSRCIVEGTV